MTKIKTFIGGTLHPGQKKIVDKIIPSNAMFFTINCPRQFGKSFLATQLILYYAINDPGSTILFTAPVHSQSKKVYSELVKGIQDSGIIKAKNNSDHTITLINGSEILFKSVQVPDNIRGLSVTYLFADEASMYRPDVFETVLRPMLTVKGKRCFLLSTPKGKKNYFYKMYALGKNNSEPRYESYIGSSDDNPYANKEEIEDARKSLPENIFKQEYLAEFTDGGLVFNNVEINSTITAWAKTVAGERYYAGLDIALQGDYMVLTIMDNKGNVVNSYRDHKKPMLTMVENIKKMLIQYNPQVTYVETNGIGNGGIFELLQKAHRSVQPFTTTNITKQEIIEDLILDFQNNDVKIPTRKFFPHYADEMSDFGFSYSPKTRKVTYNSITGHDDCVMSLALVNRARRSSKTRGRYTVDSV